MMIYQLLPESPKSGSSASNPCRLVGLKYVSSLIIAVIASVMLYVAFGVSTSELGRTGTGFFDDTTAKDVSAGPVMDRADFGGESKYVERNFEPVERIALLGERHSGTNWITDHLQECFGRVIEVRIMLYGSWYSIFRFAERSLIYFRLLRITRDSSIGFKR